MKFGYPKPKRTKTITQGKEHPKDGTHRIELSAGKHQHLRLFDVSIDLPKYRINNGRTLSAQEEWVVDKKLKDDFFKKADYESNKVQEIQHQILKHKITRTDSVNIINEFKKEQQTQPLLLTFDGFVLNGNRRLCAMREVFYSSKTKYNHFKDIEVVALPSLDEKQLQEIEARLQLKTDWEQDYSWIDQALIYKDQKEIGGISARDIASRDNVKPKWVEDTIELLDFVNEYLKWIGKPKKYSLVSSQEHSFRRLLQFWDRQKTSADKEILKLTTFQLIKNPHEGRTYTQIQDVAKQMPDLINNLSKELGKKPTDVKGLSVAIKSKTKDVGETVVDTVINTVATTKAKAKKTKKNDASIKAIRNARSNLEEALTYKTRTSNLSGFKEQIAQINASLKAIKKWGS